MQGTKSIGGPAKTGLSGVKTLSLPHLAVVLEVQDGDITRGAAAEKQNHESHKIRYQVPVESQEFQHAVCCRSLNNPNLRPIISPFQHQPLHPGHPANGGTDRRCYISMLLYRLKAQGQLSALHFSTPRLCFTNQKRRNKQCDRRVQGTKCPRFNNVGRGSTVIAATLLLRVQHPPVAEQGH